MDNGREKLFIPFKSPEKGFSNYFRRLALILSKGIRCEIVLHSPSSGLPYAYQIKKLLPGFLLSTPIETIFLTRNLNYLHIISFRFTQLRGMILINQESEIKGFKDLVNKRIFLPDNLDFKFTNPVIECLKRFSENESETKHRRPFYLRGVQEAVQRLIENDLSAVVTTSFDYFVLPEELKRRLHVLGNFYILPELHLLVRDDFREVEQFIDLVMKWYRSELREHQKIGFILEKTNPMELRLLDESIKLMEQKIEDYIENKVMPPSLELIKQKCDYELEELRKRVFHLEQYNTKLLKAYSQIKASKEDLYTKLEARSSKNILLARDGDIVAITRQFLELLEYKRDQLIGENVSIIIAEPTQDSLFKLLRSVDIGLIKNFNVVFRSYSGKEIKANLNCSILEFVTSKLILINVDEDLSLSE